MFGGNGLRVGKMKSLFDIYRSVKYLSIKHDSYFQVYEELFAQYVGKPITFVEIGVLNGGSLFMWRDYFGPQANIIGIDLNPAAKKWENEGFKIYIGSQSDPAFWDQFYREVGSVDIVLDDGGHTNNQQIVTVDKSVPFVNDGGLIVVEDTHTSYFQEFGNPGRFSFISFAKRLVDSVNSRFPSVNDVKNKYGNKIYSIAFYESIVCFHVNSKKCFVSSPVDNKGISNNALDFRYRSSLLQRILFKARHELNKVPLLCHVSNPILSWLICMVFKSESVKMKRLFR